MKRIAQLCLEANTEKVMRFSFMEGMKVSWKVQENTMLTINDRIDLVLCISLRRGNDIEIHLRLDLRSNLVSASSPVYYLFPSLIISKGCSTQNTPHRFKTQSHNGFFL